MELDKAINSRKSIREYKDKKPDWRDILECIDATRQAPMAGGIFSLQFLIVNEEKIIKKIAEFSSQEFIEQAKYVVIVITKPSQTTLNFKKRAKKYLPQQAGAAIQNFLLKLTELGLSTCWIGHFEDSQIKHLLNVPEENEIEAMFPIGYSKEKLTLKKPKSDLYQLLYFNKWGNRRMKDIQENIMDI